MIRPTVAALLLLLSLAATTAAQQKRQTQPKQQPKPAAAPTPAPTFDTLLPDSYTIYGEIRGVGQVIQSSTFNEILEPVLKLADPPKEFKAALQWLNAHAEDVMTSRLLVAGWPTASNIPSVIVAIEFASAEEAETFAKPLNEMLPAVLPPRPASESLPDPSIIDLREKPAPAPPTPQFHLQRVGSLVLISPTPLTMKQLKPAGSKLLSEDANFRAARNRFNSEPVFVFINIKAREKQEQERQKQFEEARKAAAAAEAEREKATSTEESKQAEEAGEPELTPEEIAAMEQQMPGLDLGESAEAPKDVPPPNAMSVGMSMIASSLFRLESKWPEGLGLALSFENESFDVRALLVSQAGEQSDAVPFLPMLIPGPAFTPESPGILPADTELFVTMSLDLPQIYTAISTQRETGGLHAAAGPHAPAVAGSNSTLTLTEVVHNVSPFEAIEKQLKIKIKDDLLPLLGSEIAVRLPVNNFSFLGFTVLPGGAASQANSANQQSSKISPAVAISLKDKEAMRALLPKIIEAAAFKGASSFAQTERKEDTEIVSYANLFSYAFIGNFLVLSGDPAATRHIVDSYLKHETLSADSHFRSSTRWQPRPAQGLVYISPALMEGYKTWIDKPSNRVSDQARAFLTRFISMPQPITYSLSNEGVGPLHEVHVPKNLVLMAIGGLAAESNPPPALQNERKAVSVLFTISYTQEQFKMGKGVGSYGTLEQLFSENLLSKEMVEQSGYKIEVTVSGGDKFEVTAVPVEYGKTGSMSYFIDETGVLRGADRSGASATKDDPPIH
jgi:hypothetical protein